MEKDAIESLLFRLLVNSPLLLAWLAGAVLAIIFWRRHPIVSLLTLIACLGFLLKTVVIEYVNFQILLMRAERNWSFEEVTRIYTIMGFTNTILSAIFWGLILLAVFGWRANRLRRFQDDRRLLDPLPRTSGTGGDIGSTDYRERRP